VSDLLHAPVVLPSEKEPPPPQYPLDRGPGGPQSRFERSDAPSPDRNQIPVCLT